MSEAIVVALITGGLSLAGVVATCLATAKKSEKITAIAQAVTDTKIDELTREVREHNGFARRYESGCNDEAGSEDAAGYAAYAGGDGTQDL